MKILTVHNRYQYRGGEDVVYEAEADLLEHYGHEVQRLEFSNETISSARSPLASAKLAASTVWSGAGIDRVRRVVRGFSPDIVHFHNTFPLISPAAYQAARAEGAGVVQTFHNYRLLCPNALFFRDGAPCEDCLGKAVAWPGVKHGCYRDSRVQTAVTATMLAAHRLRGTWQKDVDVFIALTEFSRQKFIDGGLPPSKIAVKPNFIDPDPGQKTVSGDYFLFAGRLAAYKGANTVLQAWATGQAPAPVHIAGDGPLESEVQHAASVSSDVEYCGRLDEAEMLEKMKSARALIFPSILYENFPVTIGEAYACGLPVIASRLGAMAEIVEDGRTGLLFEPGDPDDLLRKVRWAWEHPAELASMGAAARCAYESKYTGEQNHRQMMEIYDRARASISGQV